MWRFFATPSITADALFIYIKVAKIATIETKIMDSKEKTEVKILEKKQWPSKKDKDGCFFESEADESMGIKTIEYDNGNLTKKIELSDGRIAVIRTTFGRDNKEIARLCNGDQDEYNNAQLSVALTLNGNKAIVEDIDNMKSKDLNRLLVANQNLNF